MSLPNVVPDVKFKELAAAVKLLNDSGLLEKPILTVGVSKEVIIEEFLKGVLSVPDDADGNWTGPKEVAEYYEKIVLPDPKVVEEEKKMAKKEKAPKEPKEKKEKVPKAPKEKTKSSTEIMKDLLKQKASDEEILKVFTEKLTKKDPKKATADFIAKRVAIYKKKAKE